MKPRSALLTGIALVALPFAAAIPTVTLAAPLPVATTYADLLEPVPNAGSLLAADDANHSADARLQLAQYYRGDRYYRDGDRDHHHHHHHHSRRWYQDNGYYWHGGSWIIRPRYHHHHHHHQYRDRW